MLEYGGVHAAPLGVDPMLSALVCVIGEDMEDVVDVDDLGPL